MMIIGDFLVRFAFFWFKIVCSCVFVIFLQVQVGQKSLEEWIEQALKQSMISRYLNKTSMEAVRVMNKKFPQFKGITENRIIKNDSVMELYSGILQGKEDALNRDNEDNIYNENGMYNYENQQRSPASP